MTSSNDEAVDAFIGALINDDAELLYERAPCGYLSTTPDGTIVKVNQTLLTLLGYERGELVGRKRFDELLSPGGRIYHETHYAPLIRMQGSAREIAFDLVRRDGSRLPALVNSVLDTDPDGVPIVIRTAVFDATERREYERELLHARERAEISEAHATTLARTLQQTLIPPSPPSIPHLDIAAEYRPAGDGTEVGGDFYDMFQVAAGHWVIVLGDVCGKGVEAAVVTALVRYTLRASAFEHAEPCQALAVLNEVLQRHETERFCTVVLVRLEPVDGGWRAVVSSGGHALPLLRSPDGTISTIGRPGSLLGVVDDPDLYDVSAPLQHGDTLLLFTDGVTEGRAGKQFYGEQRVREVLAAEHASADSLASTLLSDVVEFQHGMVRDDIAIVVLRAE